MCQNTCRKKEQPVCFNPPPQKDLHKHLNKHDKNKSSQSESTAIIALNEIMARCLFHLVWNLKTVCRIWSFSASDVEAFCWLPHKWNSLESPPLQDFHSHSITLYVINSLTLLKNFCCLKCPMFHFPAFAWHQVDGCHN